MYKEIFELFEQNKDEQKAAGMAAYMKNNFPFLGIPKPERTALSKAFLKEKKKEDGIDWDLVFECYDKAEREFQYLAVAYLNEVKDKLTYADISDLERVITTKSWWDTVDSVDKLAGEILKKDKRMRRTVIRWAKSDNIWLKRTAINLQRHFKEDMDTDLLAKVIEMNMDTGEFFVDKAIGWVLREYSKTNKEWVSNFIETHPLSKLSVREGSKYL